MVSFAEGTLRTDVHVDGREAEVVSGVVGLRFGQVEVTRYLGYKPAAIIFLDEVGKLVQEPPVG